MLNDPVEMHIYFFIYKLVTGILIDLVIVCPQPLKEKIERDKETKK